MAVRDNQTKTANISVAAREIDFVTRFGRNWDALRDILGIMRPIRKQPGTVLKSKVASITLQNGTVAEGEIIPLSLAEVVEKPYAEMNVEKYAKSVSIEAIKDHGYDVAVGMTDDAFLNELQGVVMGRFYDYLNTGALTDVETTYQMALAMAKGLVVNKWKKLHRTATEIVGFANVLDVYEYLGTANITVQNQFGFQYIKDFMGYNTIFLLSDDEIKRGRVAATPVENIVLYYVDPSDSDFARAGLDYRTDGETNLIGFHTEGNYSRAVSDSYAVMGMVLFAEYIDGIAIVDTEESGTLGALTVTSAEGAVTGTTKITVSQSPIQGGLYFYKTAASTAPAVTYKQKLDSTWTAWDGVSDITATNAEKITIAETNGAGQVMASGNTTVTAKN